MANENQEAGGVTIVEIRASEGGQKTGFMVETWDQERFRWLEAASGELMPNETRSIEVGEQSSVKIWRVEGPAEGQG